MVDEPIDFYRHNCRAFYPDRTPPLKPLGTEFVDLIGRSVKTNPNAGSLSADTPAMWLRLGTDPDLLKEYSTSIGVPWETTLKIVAHLAYGTLLCPDMARELVWSLNRFIDQHPQRCVVRRGEERPGDPRMEGS